MGQAANYLCSEPELKELQIASETERAAWTTSQSPPSSHTRCSFEKPLQRLYCEYLASGVVQLQVSVSIFFCKTNVKISKLLPTKNRFWKFQQHRANSKPGLCHIQPLGHSSEVMFLRMMFEKTEGFCGNSLAMLFLFNFFF